MLENEEKTTDNGRFYEMAAVAPHKPQCDFGGFVPARSSVKPPLHKAASTLSATRGRQCEFKLTK
jgi:hypothetical protein